VLLLATPIVLEMSMESLFAVVDIAYVSRLGSDAVAVVGLGETMLSPVYALAIGLSAGATALVARRVGEKRLDQAAGAAGQVILVAIACALVVGLGGALFARTFFSALGASDHIREHGGHYASTLLGGSVTVFLLFVFNALFRSTGDAFVCMRALWLANGLNIVLAPLLIFGLGPLAGFGVLGGAIATTASRGIGVLYQLFVLLRGRSRKRLPFEPRHLLPRPKVMMGLVRLGTTATMQVSIETVSWLGLVRILTSFGSLAVAGYTIAMRVTTFVLLPALGVAGSVATLVGQNLGANEPERARSSLKLIATYNTVFLVFIGAALAIAPRLVLRFFTTDEGVIRYAEDCLRIVAVGFVVLAQGMVTVQAFNGAGDPLTPMAINLGAFWLVRVPLAWALATRTDLGARGVFVAITASYFTQAAAGTFAFRLGRWQRRKV
jgi:putative MATE family efflux protein